MGRVMWVGRAGRRLVLIKKSCAHARTCTRLPDGLLNQSCLVMNFRWHRTEIAQPVDKSSAHHRLQCLSVTHFRYFFGAHTARVAFLGLVVAQPVVIYPFTRDVRRAENREYSHM